MAYLYGVWVCFIAFGATAIFRLMVVKRMRSELVLQSETPRSDETQPDAEFQNLRYTDFLKEHRSRFPVSSTRSLSNVLLGLQLLATVAGVTLGVLAQFQPHSLYHMISTAR